MEPAPEEAGPASKLHQPSSPHPDIQPAPALRPETDDVHDDSTTNNHNHHGAPQSSASSTSTSSRPVSAVVPPYWRRHERNTSHVSQSSLRGAARITLEDHTADPNSETSRGLWASSVTIDDHVIVRGMTGVGSYVVWNCTVQTLDVSFGSWRECGWNRLSNLVVSDIGWTDCCSDEVCCLSPFSCPCLGFRGCLADSWTCYRYSEFDDLRQRLVDSFPHARNALPALPPKSVICTFWCSFSLLYCHALS